MLRCLTVATALSMMVGSPIYAASLTNVSATSSVNTTANSAATGFGSSSVVSFGTAGSSVVVTPGFAATTSVQQTSVRGQSFGTASYNGSAKAFTAANGVGAWSAPH